MSPKWLALAMAILIGFVDSVRKERRKNSDLLVAFFNGLLIYVSATGINAVSTGVDFKKPNAQVSSFLPFIKERPWWTPVIVREENEALRREGASLQPKIDERLILRTERALDEQRIMNSVRGRQGEVLKLAFDLYSQKIPYKWGGKNPRDGFDSSGYVAYILAQVGAIEDPQTYWSGKLRSSLQKVQQEQVGDIIFYTSGACMIYLGEGMSIGMLPGGIVTGSLDNPETHFARLGVGRY